MDTACTVYTPRTHVRLKSPEPSPAGRGDPRRGPAAHRCRGGNWQDHDSGGARRVSDRTRCRPLADPAAHVQPARRARDAGSRRADDGGDGAGRVWGGTFHAVANRLLRLDGRPLGVRPDFTVLDQADGADVMNLIRDELGFSARRTALPAQGDARGDLLPHGQRRREARRRPGAVVPVVRGRGRRHAADLRGVHRAQARAERPRLRRPAAVLARARRAGGDRALAATFDHVLVDEYQDTNALQADILEGMRPPGGATTSPSSATTRSRSTGSARRPSATSSSSPSGSPARRSSGSSRTTGRRPPMLAASNAVIALIARSATRRRCGPNATGDGRPDAAHLPGRGRAIRCRVQGRARAPRGRGRRCTARPCCSARRTTATCWRSSSRGGTSRS